MPPVAFVRNKNEQSSSCDTRKSTNVQFSWTIVKIPQNATTDQSESGIPEGCVKAFLKCLITMFAVFPVPRDEQYHGYTYQRLSRKGCVLPDPKCWAAHRIHCHFAYYPVCWRHQSGVERKKRMKVRNKEQLFSVPETQNLRQTQLAFLFVC